jgi:hypothetical protein
LLTLLWKRKFAGHYMQNAGRGIWRKFSGLSRERRDGWSPYFVYLRRVAEVKILFEWWDTFWPSRLLFWGTNDVTPAFDTWTSLIWGRHAGDSEWRQCNKWMGVSTRRVTQLPAGSGSVKQHGLSVSMLRNHPVCPDGAHVREPESLHIVLDSLKPGGNCMYHHLQHLWTQYFAHKVYLRVSNDSEKKQRLFP